MKKFTTLIILTILAAMLLAACGEEKTLGEWQMPSVDSAPTATPKPAQSFGGGTTTRYEWNEGSGFNMSMPGVTVPTTTKTLTHAQILELFGGQFLPATIFNESYGQYQRMYFEQVKHSVLLDSSGALADNAYVELRYLNKDWVEASSITVYAELVDSERAAGIYASGQYPHLSYAEGTNVQLSLYYLDRFVLTKIGDVRYAQWLVLPANYFSFVEQATKKNEEEDAGIDIPRIPLLTFTCREKVSDEQFIAAVVAISRSSAASITLPDLNAVKLPQVGEKGAA